jgi:RIO kinase 1
MKYESYTEEFDLYEDQFDPLKTDRQARRKRKPKAKHTPKKSAHDVLTEIADAEGLESGFQTTYQPSRFESGWLLESLRGFYDQTLIVDVLAQVKGGKEANVYRCEAHPSTGMDLLAAKVYRPRMFRQLRNDKMYREGRAILTDDGTEVKPSDQRIMRALNKKTDFGAQVEHTSWLMYEFTTLQRLYAAGAAVPVPIAAGENAILMGYHGDESIAAPPLSEVTLDAREAPALFHEVMRNVEIMLQNHMIHGDLSAYNILYWDGRVTLIDFPQVVNSQTNSQAQMILSRDIQRVCDYFSHQGVACEPEKLTEYFWNRYVAKRPHEAAADLSALLEREEDDDNDDDE